MASGGSADAKRSDKVEGEDVFRTVECLRGRLLAERVNSRNAKEQADQIEIKLIELERKLQEETKSRNRAEKKLKFLMKKLESLNIYFVSDESGQSSLLDKSEIASVVSSVASSSTKEATENKQLDANVANSRICDIQESIENSMSTVVPGNLQQNVAQASTYSQSHDIPADGEANDSVSNGISLESTVQDKDSNESEQNASQSSTIGQCNEETLGSSAEVNFAKSYELECSEKGDQLKVDDHSLKCSTKEKTLNGNGDQEKDGNVDNSLALVLVDLPKQTSIDPVVLDATVKQVLDSLRHAKEKLQTSMERRRVIRVG